MDQDVIHKGHIVIVDDNPQYVSALREILEGSGFVKVAGYSDPFEALEEIQARPCDLLVLDLHMPGMNGIEFLIELQKSHSLDKVFPVLIMTGDTDPGLRDTALALGTMDYLTKPVRRNEVLLRVRNLLRIRMLHSQVRKHAEELESRVAERTHQLQEAHMDTIHRLARAAEFRDDVTGGHIQRVGETACLLAQQLDTDKEFALDLLYAAQLHDIGKIAIPDAVLLKPGKLTAEEFDLIKKHAELGAEILRGSPSKLLHLAAEVAISHHERWDGKGYPRGLSGEAIPLSGRITSVADVFDALTHERPYKKAWTSEEATAEILAQSGIMFDPEVVSAFLVVVSSEEGVHIPRQRL